MSLATEHSPSSLPASRPLPLLKPCSQALYFGSSGLNSLNSGEFTAGDDDSQFIGIGLLPPVLFCVVTVGLGWAFAWAMLHLIITFSRQILQVFTSTYTRAAGKSSSGWMGLPVPLMSSVLLLLTHTVGWFPKRYCCTPTD